jgi:hypothetical protein
VAHAHTRSAVLTKHVDRLYRAAWALCGSREDAEDLVQETFARVLSRPRVLRGDDELYYLMRVLRNTFFTSRRTASRRPVTVATLEDVVAADPRPMGQPEQALEMQEVYATIASCRRTVVWRWWPWTCSDSPTRKPPARCACARRRSRPGCSGRASRSSRERGHSLRLAPSHHGSRPGGGKRRRASGVLPSRGTHDKPATTIDDEHPSWPSSCAPSTCERRTRCTAVDVDALIASRRRPVARRVLPGGSLGAGGGRRGRGARDRGGPQRRQRRPPRSAAPGRRADAARGDAPRAAREQRIPRPARRRGRWRAVPLLGGPLRLAQHRDAQRPGRGARGHDGLLLPTRAAGGSATRSSPEPPRHGSAVARSLGAAECPTGCSPCTAPRS